MAERDWVKFLGTAGARFMMVRQLRATGGMWYSLGGSQFLVDPGPGSLVRCAASRPRLDPLTLDAIVLSHSHLDHSGDVNVMIEAMTDGGFKRRGRLFCPREALEDDPVILRYVREFVTKVEVLAEGSRYELSDTVRLQTPVRHNHPAETYGLIFETPERRIAHITDTMFFAGLVQAYSPCDVLIMNVARLKPIKGDTRDIRHLTLEDARVLVTEIRPKVAIMTHFGMTMHHAKPWELAAQLSHETGIEVHAASDGTTYQL